MSGLILNPDLTFRDLERRLEGAGWSRRPVLGVTRPILPEEPELAQWRNEADGTLLTYTFNPVVLLRLLSPSGAAAGAHRDALANLLPVLGAEDIAAALDAGDEATILRGILAAGEAGAFDLAGRIGLLAAHREPAIASAAARVHLELLHGEVNALVAGGRIEELNPPLNAICGNAMPLLSALPDATPDEILGLQPMEEDCEAVLAGDIGRAVFEAYEPMWANPPAVAPGSDRQTLRVQACPAALFVSENACSLAFPSGYRAIAGHLRPGFVWLAWRYCRPGSSTGLAFDGLVNARGNWVWFPKIYNVIQQLRGSAPR